MDKKILVIDDEEDFSYFVKKSLEAISNYKIITASKGIKRHNAFSLIVGV